MDPYLVNEMANPYNQWSKLGCASNYLNYVNPNGDSKDHAINSSNDSHHPVAAVTKLATYVTDNTESKYYFLYQFFYSACSNLHRRTKQKNMVIPSKKLQRRCKIHHS